MCGTEKEPQDDLEKALEEYAAVSRADCKPEHTHHREVRGCPWIIH